MGESQLSHFIKRRLAFVALAMADQQSDFRIEYRKDTDEPQPSKELEKGLAIIGEGGCGKTVICLRCIEYQEMLDPTHPRERMTEIVESVDEDGNSIYTSIDECQYTESPTFDGSRSNKFIVSKSNSLIGHTPTVLTNHKLSLYHPKYIIKVDISDLPGQSEYYDTLPTMVALDSLDYLVLMYDITDLTSLVNGIRMVKMMEENRKTKKKLSIVLVGNKKDLLNKKINGKIFKEADGLEAKIEEARKAFKIVLEVTLSGLLFDESAKEFYNSLINLFTKKKKTCKTS